MTPPISTHNQLASALFEKHGVGPTKVVEADDEVVVGSLVVSGVGMGLMREDLAFEKEKAGQVCLWQDVRLTTTLQFLYLREREQDPVIRALLDVLTGVWDPRPAKPQRRSQPRRRSVASAPAEPCASG
jgi:DNA-binding transcriptional LysR family regulator